MKTGSHRFLISMPLLAALLSCPMIQAEVISLTSPDQLNLVNLVAQRVIHNGKDGIQLMFTDSGGTEESPLAVIRDVSFHNGIIECELSGKPREDAGARGFIGIAFRVQKDDMSSYECLYLRPTNGRANDQLRRNHTVQYTSQPDFTWNRLREESPGMYESYTDIGPDEWIQVKIVVSGDEAQLYVTNMEQPCLIVNDLKHGDSQGLIALWMEPSTEAYVRNMTISQE